VVFKFTNLVCMSYNESWFVFHYCQLKAVSRDKVVLYANGTILHPASFISIHGKVFKKESGYKPWLLESKLDACRFLKRSYDPFAKIVYGFFKDFTNMNHTCPYVVSCEKDAIKKYFNILYFFQGLQYVRGVYLRPELLKLPFPSGDYMLGMRWYFHKNLICDTNVSFTFT
ncbi:hypothetical protein KR067_008613, partial [Drosophila pandora]